MIKFPNTLPIKIGGGGEVNYQSIYGCKYHAILTVAFAYHTSHIPQSYYKPSLGV